MLDAVAQRYGHLPSKLLCDADSFDIMVFDVALTYERMQRNKQEGKADQTMYAQEDLQEIMDKVKTKK